MPAEFYYRNAGVWNKMTEIGYYQGATLRDLASVWYNNNGTWLQVFNKAAAAQVSLTNRAITGSRNTSGGSGTATAIYRLSTDGIAKEQKTATSNSDSLGPLTDLPGNDWWTAKPQAGIGSSYEVRATVASTSGTGTLTGTIGAWTTINPDQLWQLQDTGNNVERNSTRTLTIEIGLAGQSTAIASASITLNAFLFGP